MSQGTEQSKSATSQLTEMQAYATEASEPKMNAEDRKQVLKQSHAAQTTTEIQPQGIDTSQHKDKEDPEDLEQVLKRVQEIQNSKQVKAKSKMENHADEPSSIWKQITEFILLAMQKSDDNDDNDNDRHHTRTTSSAMIFAYRTACIHAERIFYMPMVGPSSSKEQITVDLSRAGSWQPCALS